MLRVARLCSSGVQQLHQCSMTCRWILILVQQHVSSEEYKTLHSSLHTQDYEKFYEKNALLLFSINVFKIYSVISGQITRHRDCFVSLLVCATASVGAGSGSHLWDERRDSDSSIFYFAILKRAQILKGCWWQPLYSYINSETVSLCSVARTRHL